MPEFHGTVGNDSIDASGGDDVVHGYHGDDVINGLAGNDRIYGGGSLQQLDTNGIVATHATTARINLESIAKGFHNTVGMYKVTSDGAIHGVNILFSPDGGKNGGQAIYPNKSIEVDLKAGEQLGFFVLGNGYGKGNLTDMLNDPQAQWALRTPDGEPGLIVDNNLQLWHIDPATGNETKLAKGSGHEIFHSIGTEQDGFTPNPDGLPHAVAIVDKKTGTVKLGLEAQKNGGNLSFDDAIISIELGASNVEGLDDALIPLAGTDNDIIDGGKGDDTIFGQAGNDRLIGGEGNDTISGGTGNDVISGGDGSDQISGGKGDDTVGGDAGDDVIKGDTGNDNIDGGDGDDDIKGGEDDDAVRGGPGDDLISGGKGVDEIYGEAGNDTITGNTGNDIIDGGDGDDVIHGNDDDDILTGGAGNDTITGGKGNDTLTGGDGTDNLDADSGDDTIIADAGDDIYNGGSGIDVIDYSAATGGIVADLNAKTVTSALGNHQVSSIENIIATAFDDQLTGDKRDNDISAGTGDDWLRGGKGDDTLNGGPGADTFSWTRKDVTGDLGADNFLDTIVGFETDDILDLSALTEIAAGQSATDVVQLKEAGGHTTVSAFNAATSVWVNVTVLADVTGLTVETLDANGQLVL